MNQLGNACAHLKRLGDACKCSVELGPGLLQAGLVLKVQGVLHALDAVHDVLVAPLEVRNGGQGALQANGWRSDPETIKIFLDCNRTINGCSSTV